MGLAEPRPQIVPEGLGLSVADKGSQRGLQSFESLGIGIREGLHFDVGPADTSPERSLQVSWAHGEDVVGELMWHVDSRQILDQTAAGAEPIDRALPCELLELRTLFEL